MKRSHLHLLFAALALTFLLFAERPATAQDPSYFSIARLKYGGGGDWYGNQSSLRNVLLATRNRLGIPIASDVETVVSPLDESLFRHPFLFMSGHGNVKFSPAETDRLHAYLTSGGFLWCDDDFGIDASFRREMRKIFPDRDLIELPFDHPVFHQVYRFPKGLPKIHEHDGGPARAFALLYDGRVAVLYTFDTDLGDGLEDEGVHQDTPEKREQAIQMTLNIVAYALNN